MCSVPIYRPTERAHKWARYKWRKNTMKESTTTKTTTGTITQIIGPVVDVRFEEDVPAIYNALVVTKEDDTTLTLEVQQQLAGNVVRTIAMSSTESVVSSSLVTT